jgi:hypothetical protein
VPFWNAKATSASPAPIRTCWSMVPIFADPVHLRQIALDRG